MSYHFTKDVDYSYDEAINRVTDLLKEHGFGILTEINVKETLKNKIDVDFHPYMILGACNPEFAHKALLAENKIGLMLPCNVIVQQRSGEKVQVSAVDPVASMQAVENSDLGGIATEVRQLLQKVIETL